MLVISIWFLVNNSNVERIVVSEEGGQEVVLEEDIPYSKQMCNAQGECGEDPSTPSARTTFSSRSKSEDLVWFALHEKLVESSASYQTPSTTHKRDVVFVGDSITESFLGTSYDEDDAPRLVGVKEVFLDFCKQQDINPLVLAISGDQTQHLLYRLRDGELGNNLKSNPKLTFVLHIGTNNIGSGFLPGETAAGMIKVAEYILEETMGQLLVVLPLPRGDGKLKLVHMCPPRCDYDGQPFESFLSPLRSVNQLVTEWFQGLKTDRVSMVSCWDLFINANNNNLEVKDRNYDLEHEVDIKLMPDKLHPNAAGHVLFLNRVATKL